MAKRTYTVKAGESLSIIARDQLGDISRWPEIAYINSISEPYTIFPGQNILLPANGNGMVVEITEYGPNGAAAPKKAALEFTPATLAIFAVVAVAVFSMWDQR